jgi:aldose 1-epimerase
MRAPTGRQFELGRTLPLGRTTAIITEVAAGIRALSVDGVDLVETYPEHVAAPFGSGTVLAPWPNRVRDATWTHDGETLRLAVTEPARNNALHGLLAFSPYSAVEQSDSAITLAATVFPQTGYPFQVDTTVRYELQDDGVTVTHGFENAGAARVPVAVGAHPFFRLGDVPTQELVLTLDAATRFEVDARLNPLREVPVDGTDYDLRSGRRVGDLSLDTAFGGVTRGGVHTLASADGRSVEIWQDDSFGYVQVFITDLFPDGDGFARAIAIEPMTAPPDALNSGLGLIWLEPGERWSGSWGVRLRSGSTSR